MRLLVCIFLAACARLFAADAPASLADLQRAFENPPDDARIMMRWWWFGAGVTKAELEKEMRQMKEGGIGGFEVQPVYPLALDDPSTGFKNLPYMSKEFLDALSFTAQKAKELGLRMDLTLCSGWPYGGPHIPVTQASARLRVEHVNVPAKGGLVPVPDITAGEKLIAVFQGTRRITAIDHGMVTAPADAANPKLTFFIAGRTGQMVKRPALGSEGFVLDHYDRAAVTNHLKTVGDKLMGALGKNVPYAVFSDSLEVYGNDWTGDFLEEFQKRRGYDLLPLLPALAGDIGEKTMDVRRDWGMTLTELTNERYLTPVREWAHQHGTKFRSQTYGIPPVSLSSNALVDLPEGEGTQWRQASSTRWATSASHLYGRPVTSSETWTWLHSPVFRATPLDMKAEADLHFLQGVNQLIGHGWPYSPDLAGEPGWRFYAAAVFNAHNPWWLVMPDISKYLQRISFLLRQGEPANDVALYVPTQDAWAGFTTVGRTSINQALDALLGPDVIPQILDSGHNFDLIDDEAIEKRGIKHPVLIIAGAERIPESTRKILRGYVEKGGILIVTRRRTEIPGARFIADEKTLGEKLTALLPPDLKSAPDIGFVHRKLDYGDAYFVVNTSNHPVHTEAVFRVTGLEPAWWNPFTGKSEGAGTGNRLMLDLAPFESRVVVFSKQRLPVPASAKSGAPIEVGGTWRVTFDGRPPVEMSTLHSWSDDEATRYYTGSATYENTVMLDAVPSGLRLYFGEGTPVAQPNRGGSGMRAWFEGPVHEAAKVYINGKLAGSVWTPPYEVSVDGLLHTGVNQIRIVVANLAFNRLVQGPLPDYKLLNSRFGERFQAQDLKNLEVVPSGLLGPIRLVW